MKTTRLLCLCMFLVLLGLSNCKDNFQAPQPQPIQRQVNVSEVGLFTLTHTLQADSIALAVSFTNFSGRTLSPFAAEIAIIDANAADSVLFQSTISATSIAIDEAIKRTLSTAYAGPLQGTELAINVFSLDATDSLSAKYLANYVLLTEVDTTFGSFTGFVNYQNELRLARSNSEASVSFLRGFLGDGEFMGTANLDGANTDFRGPFTVSATSDTLHLSVKSAAGDSLFTKLIRLPL
ncbi:MAG: hypothetical protein AAFO69_15700 [Bacteroidota bacterium]